MASNDPSRRASIASSSDMSPVDPASAANILPKKDRQSSSIKLKKSIAKNSRPKDSGKLVVASHRPPIWSRTNFVHGKLGPVVRLPILHRSTDMT
ncbi:MAG: hypothetical protein Q9215_001470 [Flavoplaca cf. flavocitrina]